MFMFQTYPSKCSVAIAGRGRRLSAVCAIEHGCALVVL
jgi:hypothetical protein